MLKRNQSTICCYLRFNIVCPLTRVTSLSSTVPCNVRCHAEVSLEQEFYRTQVTVLSLVLNNPVCTLSFVLNVPFHRKINYLPTS